MSSLAPPSNTHTHTHAHTRTHNSRFTVRGKKCTSVWNAGF